VAVCACAAARCARALQRAASAHPLPLLSLASAHLRPPLTPPAPRCRCQYRIHNADITNREPHATVDDLIDTIENAIRPGRVVYIPCLYVLNKIDSITIEELDLLDRDDLVDSALVRAADVVVDCCDSLGARYVLADACAAERRAPSVFANLLA
jgi:hypothetical protein